ncbi:hypothetical protein ACU4GD_33915 [Cupriavidus basilensis]
MGGTANCERAAKMSVRFYRLGTMGFEQLAALKEQLAKQAKAAPQR